MIANRRGSKSLTGRRFPEVRRTGDALVLLLPPGYSSTVEQQTANLRVAGSNPAI